MKAAKRQARRLPLPDGPTLTLALDDGRAVVLDRTEAQLPAGMRDVPCVAFMGHGLLVIVTRSLHPEHGPLLHASMSHASGQLPDWYLLKALKRALFPDNVAAMVPLPDIKTPWIAAMKISVADKARCRDHLHFANILSFKTGKGCIVPPEEANGVIVEFVEEK